MLRDPWEVFETGRDAPRGAVSKIFPGLRSQAGGERGRGSGGGPWGYLLCLLTFGAAGRSCTAPQPMTHHQGRPSESLSRISAPSGYLSPASLPLGVSDLSLSLTLLSLIVLPQSFKAFLELSSLYLSLLLPACVLALCPLPAILASPPTSPFSPLPPTSFSSHPGPLGPVAGHLPGLEARPSPPDPPTPRPSSPPVPSCPPPQPPPALPPRLSSSPRPTLPHLPPPPPL